MTTKQTKPRADQRSNVAISKQANDYLSEIVKITRWTKTIAVEEALAAYAQRVRTARTLFGDGPPATSIKETDPTSHKGEQA